MGTLQTTTIDFSTLTTSPIPLTTTFKGPPWCFNGLDDSVALFSLGNDIFYGDNIALGDNSLCIPSGSHPTDRSYAFSPGLYCPQSFTTAERFINPTNQFETRVVCCPVLDGIPGLSGSTMSYNPDTTSLQWYATYGCIHDLTESIAGVPYIGESTGTPSRLNSTLVFNEELNGGIIAYSVQLAFQATDLSLITPHSSQMSLTSATSATRATSVTSAATIQINGQQSTSATSPNQGLPTRAKIALGVVIPVVVLLLALAGFLFMRRTRIGSLAREKTAGGESGAFIDKTPGVFVEESPGVAVEESPGVAVK